MISFAKKVVLSFIIVLLISITIVYFHSNISGISIISDKYIINFLIAILALSVAVITLLYSTVDKIRNTIIKMDVLDDEQISDIEKKIKRVFDELREDTFLILYSLIFILILVLIKDWNFPLISWPKDIFISRLEFFMSVRLTIMILNVIALVDIVVSLFKIIKASNKISDADKESN